ncbi:MAG: DUF4388 domain-containing protein [Acidobacteria bacterium]|nr:DUF4388 domain-containing protein [Acidobacteriota bacterium]
MAIAGNLRTMQLSELLQWLSTGLKSGTLVVRGAPGEKRIYFENGRVTSSSSTLEREHLGRFLVGFGFITEEELIRALEVQQESRILLGKILVMIGAIKEAELADLVRLKAAETIYDIFLWTEGSFAFIDGEIPQLPMVPISSDVTGIVMEGLRRYDEWQRIKTKIASMRQIPSLAVPVEETLGEREKLILGAINGRRAIDQIALETHNPEFHVAKLVFDLMQSGHVSLAGEREDAAAAPVFADAESEAEAASAFDPILGSTADDASFEPRPRVEEYLLSPPGPRTPPPTDYGRFLKRGPDSDVTQRRRTATGASNDTQPAVKTPPPVMPAIGSSLAAPAAAPAPPAAAPPAAPAKPAAPAPAAAPAKHPQAPAEPAPKIPPTSIPILTKPMEELMSFAFTPNEAFIVSRINGMWDVRSIARISPFPEAEVLRVFAKLQTSGVITFK